MSNIKISGNAICYPGLDTTEDLYCKEQVLHQPEKFDPAKVLGKKGLRYKDDATKLALCAAMQALENAGLPTSSKEQLEGERFGVVVSSNLGNVDTVCKVQDCIEEGTVDSTSPMDLPNASSNVIASTIAIRFGLKGVNLMVTNGATGSVDALYLAQNALLSGRCSRVLVVAVEPKNDVIKELVERQSFAIDFEHLSSGAAAVVLEKETKENESCFSLKKSVPFPQQDVQEFKQFFTAQDWSTSDLWMLPNLKFENTKNLHQEILDSESSLPKTFDLSAKVGDLYGAIGLFQLVYGLEFLKTNESSKVLLSSGLDWGDSMISHLTLEK